MVPGTLEVRFCGRVVDKLQSVDVVGDVLEGLGCDLFPVLDLLDEPLLSLRCGGVESKEILRAQVAVVKE